MTWCTECKQSYPDGTEVCPVCGELLDERQRPESCDGNCASCGMGCAPEGDACTGDCDQGIWPTDDSGEPVKPARLMTVTGTQLDYELTVAQLRSYGVPVVGSFTADGTLAKVILGFAGTGMDVLVPETMVELARELMKPVEGEAEDA